MSPMLVIGYDSFGKITFSCWLFFRTAAVTLKTEIAYWSEARIHYIILMCHVIQHQNTGKVS